MQLLDGKLLSTEILAEMAAEVQQIVAVDSKRPPHLVAILVGANGASETYVASKIRNCELIGFRSTLVRFPETVSQAELLARINQINGDSDIDGLIVQLPLPEHISGEVVTMAIDADKDVDGFHPSNFGKVAKGLDGFIAATPLGILLMMERYKLETKGRHVVVVGRSQIVGLPMAMLLQRNAYPGNATVTICHSHTRDIEEMCASADILIAALGKPNFIVPAMVREGAVVIDVGLQRVADASKKSGFRLAGDVDFEAVAPKTSYITPVPGGVGLMTICGLLANTLKAYKANYKAKYGADDQPTINSTLQP